MSTTARLSVDDYLAHDFPPRTQLVAGEVVIVNEPSFRHIRIADYLYGSLAGWAQATTGRGEAGQRAEWVLGGPNVYVPDVWWLREERRPGRDALRVEGPADLVVEVLSPSTRRYDLGPKRAVYERDGALELWLVDTDPDGVVVERRSHPDAAGFDVRLELQPGDALTSPLLPGLEVLLSELFDR
ncbi:MAG: Uma2 family endonuclease [Acidimicrobiia bacterium]